MDDVTGLVLRAQSAIATARSHLATARYARWEGIHAEHYRALLADHEARAAAIAGALPG